MNEALEGKVKLLTGKIERLESELEAAKAQQVTVTIGATVPTMQYGNLQYSVTVTGQDAGELITQAREAIRDSVTGMILEAIPFMPKDQTFEQAWRTMETIYKPLVFLKAAFPQSIHAVKHECKCETEALFKVALDDEEAFDAIPY